MLHNRVNPQKLICRIDVTAFVSVVILLVFTMLIAVAARGPLSHRERMDLARVWHPKGMWRADRQNAILVIISRDGVMFLGPELVAAEDLPAKIAEDIRNGSERKVYIKADAHVRYYNVSAVLDEVRIAGVENVAFLVDQRIGPVVAHP